METIPIANFLESKTLNATSELSVKSLSILDMFLQADLFIQSIMLILILMSLYSWSLMLTKTLLLKSFYKELDTFNALLEKHDYNISLIERKKFFFMKELNGFYRAIMAVYHKIYDAQKKNVKISLEEVLDEMEWKISDINIQLEDHLYILGTISSSAPFVGLLGTVWGIMNSFQSIIFLKNVGIAAVAPGISEALLATALGLVVAIPALIFNNKLYSSLELFNIKLRTYTVRLVNQIYINI